MLILSCRIQEAVIIKDDIRITVLSIRGNQVHFAIEAPNDVHVHCDELLAELSENMPD